MSVYEKTQAILEQAERDGKARMAGKMGEQLTAACYHASPGVSSSRLKDFLSDVRLYYYKYHSGRYVEEPKDHFDFGSAVHDIALLGSTADIVVIPDSVLAKNGARSGNAWKEFAAEHAGKMLLKRHDMDAVLACVEAMHKHPVAGMLLGMPGPTEHGFWYEDADLELRLKCRPDKMAIAPSGKIVLDIKTVAGNTGPQAFARQVANFGYHLQSAFYRKVLKRCGLNVVDFVFIAVSTQEPHTVDCYTLSEEFTRIGETKVENGLAALAEHTRSGNWSPKSAGQIVQLSPPNYLNYESDYEL